MENGDTRAAQKAWRMRGFEDTRMFTRLKGWRGCRKAIKMRFFFAALLYLGFLQFGAASAPGDTARLRLLFAGDIMGHDSQIESATIKKDSFYDYSPCFEYVEPMLQAADLAIGNLEVTLPGKPPYTGYPRFRSPDDLALALRYAGFDLLVTANNHSNDAGREGVIHTIDALNNLFFLHTGTFQSAAEKDAFYPLVVYKGVFKIVFLNYTYGTNGLPTKAPVIVNEINETEIEKDMAVARALQPDFIIAVMHWGNEYQRQESEDQRKLALKLFEWGADLVVGAHPHVAQPVKTYELERDGRTENFVVAYSLGNFISAQKKEHTDGGLVFEVELAKNIEENTAWINDHSYTLVWRYIRRETDGGKTFLTIPVSAFEGEDNPLGLPEEDRKAMLKFARSTRALMGQYQSRERKPSFNEIVQPTANR